MLGDRACRRGLDRWPCALKALALACLLFWQFALPGYASCSYDLNGVGYGVNCPYRGPGGGGGGYRRPVYVPPPVRQPSPAEIRRNQAVALNNQGVALEKKGRFREAIALLERSLQTNPTDVTRHNLGHANNQLGIELFNQKNFAAALQYFENALRNSPNDQVVRNNLSNAKYQVERQQREAKEAADLNRAHANIINNLLSAPVSAAASPVLAPPTPGLDFAGGAPASGATSASPSVAGAAGGTGAKKGLDFMSPGGTTAAFGTKTANVSSSDIGIVAGPKPQTKYASASAQAAAAAKDPKCIFDGRGGCASGQSLPAVTPPANSPALLQVAKSIEKNPALMKDEQFSSRFAWYRHLDSQMIETRSELEVVTQKIASGKGDTVILNAQRQTLENTVKQLGNDQSTAKKMMDDRAKTLQVTLDWPGEASGSGTAQK